MYSGCDPDGVVGDAAQDCISETTGSESVVPVFLWVPGAEHG